jgi:hypothetical protein
LSSFSALHWVITAVIALVLWKVLRGLFARKAGVMVCTTCGHHAAAAVRTRGSFAIELVLWLCFIIPGLVYSLWRLSTRGNVCASCGSPTLVDPESPVGRKLLAEQSAGAGTSATG